MPFEDLLKLIKDNDPVAAGIVNRPLRQVDENVRFLYQVLQAAGYGATVYARRQTVEAEAAVGMAVYFDATAQRFARGLAAADINNVTGAVVTADSSQVWGVVSAKHNATLADVLLFGVAAIDLSAATTDGPPAAGTYYLSGAAQGKLTRQKPPVSVPVLRRTPDGRVFVTPQFVDFLDRHTHYKFPLACRPAGATTPPSFGSRHVVTAADADARGWLPAGHGVFAGKAPPGAVFGYNLSADPGLAAAWPPVPLTNASLEWSKGLSADVGFTGVPLGASGLCVLDRNGIWWLSDCYGDVPWPVDLTSPGSDSYSDSAGPECPRHLLMEVVLYFTKVDFATDESTVLSLRSNSDRLKVYCTGDPTRAATTGHLTIDLDLNLVLADDQVGDLAIKTFDPAAAAFKRGPVTEGLYAASANVNLTSTRSGPRQIGADTQTLHQGLIGISVDPADTKELDVQLVRLDGAEEGFLGDPPVMYLEFIAAETREYRAKVHVPFDLAIASPRMVLRFEVLGRAAGTLPQLEFTARRVPRPVAGLVTPLNLPDPTDEFAVTCLTQGVLLSGNQYVEAESDPFDVAAGDTVFFTVRRLSTDGYGGSVGILRQGAVVSSGA